VNNQAVRTQIQWLVAIAVATFLPLLVYLDTSRSIVSIWNSSETFAHGYIILPITVWLIWRRRETLTRLPLRPSWPAMWLIALCGFAWLLGDFADVQVVRQYAVVAMAPAIVLTVFGKEAGLAMAFPLSFLMLAVPFGEVFIDPLINFTADFTVAALRLTGIPVLRNGTHFDIPSGSWSVVEACSGVRYLISSITLGCLYAYLTYRSMLRRALFIALSVVVPIAANGVRAYLIVMIGHLSGMQLAVGVDHLIYGWVFFGLVMFLMFWVGGLWREDEPVEVQSAAPASAADSPRGNVASWSLSQIALPSAVVVIIVAIWPIYSRYATARTAGDIELSVSIGNFESRWSPTESFTDWRPQVNAPRAEVQRFFQQGSQKVGVSIMYYRNQQQGTGLISSQNRIVADTDLRWRRVGGSMRSEVIGQGKFNVRETRLEGANSAILVWSWYWIDGHALTNDYLGKLLQAKEKLFLGGDDGAAMMVYAPYTDTPEQARVAMRGFMNENAAALENCLQTTKKLTVASLR
jgi:exosortase A